MSDNPKATGVLGGRVVSAPLGKVGSTINVGGAPYGASMSTADMRRFFTGKVGKVQDASGPGYREKTGKIEPPRDAANKAGDKDKIRPVPIEASGVVSGVVMAGIAMNSIRPMQVNPEIWDVFSSPVAILDSSFSGFRLPDPARKISEYMGPDVEFDDQCLLDPGEGAVTRQRLPGMGDYNSYALQATALVTAPLANIHGLFSGASGDFDLELFGWSGPFGMPSSRIATVGIPSHVPPNGEAGAIYPHTGPDGEGDPYAELHAPDPSVATDDQTEGPGMPVWLDLLFLSLSGGRWKLYVMRSR